MSRLFIISLFYWLFGTGILELFFQLLRLESAEEKTKAQYVLLVLGCVFMFCGLHYYLSFFNSVWCFWFDWFCLVPLAIILGLTVNPLTVQNYFPFIKNVLIESEIEKNSTAFRKSLKKTSLSMLVEATLIDPKKELRIDWYTDWFYDWAKANYKEIPESLVGENWYDFFRIKKSWRADHVECIKQNQSIYNLDYYLKDKNLYLQWTLVPVRGNKILICLNDITKLKEQEKSLLTEKEALTEMNNRLIKLGLKQLNSDV